MEETQQANRAIEIRVTEISQLFDTLDPLPFRERDLDREAEDFIVGWARELPRRQPLRIAVHLPEHEMGTKAAAALPDAISRYFAYRAEAVDRDLRELFRVGWRALLIGLAVLAVCIALSKFVSGHLGGGPIDRFIEESLVILGWVANWKPLEIFLYDWWPLARRRNLLRRLSEANVEFKPFQVSVTS
jgi:hypothetical protein